MSLPGVELYHFMRGTSDPVRDLAANVILLAVVDYCKLRHGKPVRMDRIDGEVIRIEGVVQFLKCKDKDCDGWHAIANIPPLTNKALDRAYAIYEATGTLSYEGFERVILQTRGQDKRNKKRPAPEEGSAGPCARD